MYPAMDVDGTDYYMKPMNCPHHHKIYANTPKSYRDLPYRLWLTGLKSLQVKLVPVRSYLNP